MNALLTDLYQLTMNAAYIDNNKDDTATFDLFIRKLPKDWGYFIAAGIEDAIDAATNLRFTEEDIQYMREQNLFSESYLSSLQEFKFEGDIAAVREGTPVTANTPILRVTAKRTQAQLLETILLNTINFQTMIASKASRVVNAAAPASIIDFGLRRAQGEDAAMKGARAAYIAGAAGTSNVQAGKTYGIPISGTMAHAYVMAFETELDAFRSYVKTFENKPQALTLLIDTYDTFTGAANAITVAKELASRGKKLSGVRLDSGDLAALSKSVRSMLDDAGLSYVKILASNDLNEYRIAALIADGAKIDGYGVGTELITAKPVAAIPGVYKLVEDATGPKIKLSAEKTTCPGVKQVYRVTTSTGIYSHDVLALAEEKIDGTPLLESVVTAGRRVYARKTPAQIRDYALRSVANLPAECRELHATQYSLTISSGLDALTNALKEQHVTEAFA